MRQSLQRPGRTEKVIGYFILLCLAVTAAVIVVQQRSFNPAVLVASHAAESLAGMPKVAGEAPAWMPAELNAFSAPENFTPENLYDKIDGKAELYLSSGFIGLHSQRFALKSAPDHWLEWFVYDMGSFQNAFSVFTVQRRPEGQPLDLGQYSYSTRNALYFISGSNYVEAIAASPDAFLMQAMLKLARNSVAATGPPESHLRLLDLFPKANLVAGSFALQTANAFGFDQFTNVYTARYTAAGSEAICFLISCADAQQASELRDAYRSFLLENGGKELSPAGAAGAEKPIEIMDTVEVVFRVGNYVAGVHSAPKLEYAAVLAAELRTALERTPQ